MTPGPPPTPIEIKRRRGTLRADRIGGTTDITAINPIDPVAVLGISPTEALIRVLDQGVPWLAESDVLVVVLLHDVLEFAAELREDPRSKPSDITAAYKLAHTIAGSLGFTPADRSKLGLAEVRAASKLDDLRARRKGDPA